MSGDGLFYRTFGIALDRSGESMWLMLELAPALRKRACALHKTRTTCLVEYQHRVQNLTVNFR